MTDNIINVEHLHWVASNKRSKLCHHSWQTIENTKKWQLFQPPYPECTLNACNGDTRSDFWSFFLMKFLGCHNDISISTHEHLKRKRINHWVTTDIILLKKPVESNNFSEQKSPSVTLTYPKGGFWTIFLPNVQDILVTPSRAVLNTQKGN